MGVDQVALVALLNYFRKREELLFDCSSSVESHLSADEQHILNPKEATQFDVTNEICRNKLRRVELQQNTFRYVMLVAMCSFQEELVREICKLATPDYKQKLMKGRVSWIVKHGPILQSECGIDLTQEGNLFQRMDDHRIVRNFVVHSWGIGKYARDAKDRAELQGAVDRINMRQNCTCIQFTADDELYFPFHDVVADALVVCLDLIDLFTEQLVTTPGATAGLSRSAK